MIEDRGFVMALVLTGRQYPLASDRSLMSHGMSDRMSEEGVVRFRSPTLWSRMDRNAGGQQRADPLGERETVRLEVPMGEKRKCGSESASWKNCTGWNSALQKSTSIRNLDCDLIWK